MSLTQARRQGFDGEARAARRDMGGDTLDVLLRGLLAGVAAGVVAALVAWWAVEPSLEEAIALEDAAAEEAPGHSHAEPPVSRGVQRTAGLAAGTVAVAVAGGLLAALAGLGAARLGAAGTPLRGAAVAALAGGYAMGLVPGLAYPSNPPGIGSPETSGERTVVYLAVTGLGLLAALGAAAAWRAAARWGRGRSAVAAGAVLAAGVVAAVALAGSVAIPEGYPADLLWEFRRGSLLVQAALWGSLAAGFALAGGREAERAG